ncbi:MAG: class I SAM-dependent methyltransferase [Desulfobacteraceae bacterium]|nr:MAG: class I SAM-dependent methyltransferase [Desulfobacteraceae bacterium]
MPSFRQTVSLLADHGRQEALPAIRAMLEAAGTANEYRLNRPLTPFVWALVMINLAYARLRGPARSACLDAGCSARANDAFEQRFRGRLPRWTVRALTEPDAFLADIRIYEKQEGHKPDIPFDTESDYYRLIVKDPMRIKEEQFVYSAVLNNGLLENGTFSALDLGTGSGRLAFCVADLLRRCFPSGDFEVYGLDINPLNIKDALECKNEKGYGPQVKFITADMTLTPFAQDYFSLCSAASSIYLVPAYARPLCILEMARILKTGGEGLITGPNEFFTLRDYVCCMGASNFRTYINPCNMYLAQKLGPTGVLIDRAARQRLDFAFPDTGELCLSLEEAGCEVIQVDYWPKSNVKPIMAAIRFRKTAAAGQRLSRYNIFMQRLIEERGVTPI